MLVRPYTIADREACLGIFDSNIPRFFRAEERAEYEGFLERRPGPFFVVEGEAGAIVASGGIAPGRAEPEIAVLCWGMVKSGLHRRGAGRRLLLARFEAFLPDHPETRAVVVHTSQHSAGFFARMGFRTTAIEANGYAEGLDMVTMELGAAEARALVTPCS